MAEGDRSLAVFVDFENLALGFQGRRDRFDIGRVLERLVEKGKIVVKKAYADWNRFAPYTHAMHEAAIELIEIPRRGQTGKNSADIRLCVDAMDLAYSKEHINTFVIVSGDSDFSPLVSKLKELGKHVIGLGMSESTSDLLRDNCDEFIYYEDLGQEPALAPAMDAHIPDAKRKAFALLMDALHALRRENKDVLWSSMIKDTIKRKKPSFNETYHGYRTFSEMLEDAQREGLLELDTDKRSRTYVVTRFGNEIHADPAAPPPAHTAEPSGPGITVSPTLFGPPVDASAGQPVAAEGQPGVAGGVPRKKSRRRRRRGSGSGAGQAPGNGGNGQHGPMVAYGPQAAPSGQPGEPRAAEPLPVVVDAAPPNESVEEEEEEGFGAGVFTEPEEKPAPVKEEEAPAPAKTTRRRTTSGTRTRKSTSTRAKKAAAPAEDAAPPAEGGE